MEATPIITGFLSVIELIKGFINDNDDNNNNNYEEIENLKKSYEEKMKQNTEECNEKIKAIQEESLRKEKELDKEYEKNLCICQNQINQMKNNNESLEKLLKESNDKLEKQKNKNKKLQKKHEEQISKMEKETEKLRNIIELNNEKFEKQKLENVKLEEDIKEYEKQNKENEKKYNQLLSMQKKEKQDTLDIQESKIFEIKEKNNKLLLENEEQIKKNKIELEKFSKKCKEEIEYANKKYNELEIEKKEEEEKKKKEEEIKKKKDENNKNLAKTQFIEKSKIKINQFIDKLKKNILEKNFFEEILNEYNKNEIIKIIEQIIKQINLREVFDEKTKNYLNLVQPLEVNPEMNHLNILLLGPTGSGKSTLINVLLELEGQERAEVGDDNNPKTMEFHAYTSKKKKYIRCFDSRGIEKNKEYSLDEFIKNSKGFILKKLKENNPDEFIHIILYCFEGNRFVNEVRDSLYKLMDLYSDETLPIILVHTRGVQGEDNELFEIIKETLKKERRKIDLINICAEKDDDFPAFGIDELYRLMISKVKQSIKSACFSSVQNKVRDNFIKVNIDYKNIFKEKFEKIIIKEMKNIKLNTNISEQKIKYIKIFSYHIFEKILFDNKKELNKDCKNILENYFNYFFKWILEKSEEYMINFISRNSFELISDLLNVQHSINSQYDNKLQIQKNTEEWKEEIDKKLKLELDNVILFSLMKEGSFFIYDEFNKMLLNILEKSYKEYLQNENEYIINITKGKVEEIINNFVFN